MGKKEYSHLATVYGILAYYNSINGLFKGTTKFRNFLMDVCIWCEIALDIDFMKVKKIRLLKEDEKYQ